MFKSLFFLLIIHEGQDVKSYQSQSKGFTLIELIVVIVILGIMAAVAGPKFINLQADARASVMKGIEGSVRSAATLVYSKSLIAGTEASAASTVTVSGIGTIDTVYGYPLDTTGANNSINELIDLSGATSVTEGNDGVFTYTSTTACTVTYVDPTAPNTPPTITVDVSNC